MGLCDRCGCDGILTALVAMREGIWLRKDRSKAKSAGVSEGPPGLSILEVAKQKKLRSEGERE